MSIQPPITTPPKPEIDRAHIALALTILSSKPPTLSTKAYLHLLRTHTAPSSRRHLDTSAFWHAQATKHAEEVELLQAKLRETESAHSSSAAHASTSLEMDWQAFKDEEGEGEVVFELLSALRILKCAGSPGELAGGVKKVAGALRGVVCSVVKGRRRTSLPAARRKRGGRKGKGKGKKSAGDEDGKRDCNDVISAVESTLEKVVAALRELGDDLQEEEGEDERARREYATTAACAVIETSTGLINSIYTNSQTLHSAAPSVGPSGEGVMEVKDLRLGLCNAVIQTLSSLNPEVPTEASVIEGVMCHLLEGAGRVLSANGRESAVVKETSWYLMKMLKEVMPLYDALEETGLGKKRREELRGVFISGVLGAELGLAEQAEGMGQSENCVDQALASPFAKAIWGLMGWNVFSAEELNNR
ncbi:hypothetical protein L873DRAFT_1329523 [Choiromyces venosus 120613-1]|uniref:Uncharacterized protein n=1 Tax=Choiromyces venosus 120613-1 TaxID=1336337 RepID=A0A3N4JER8_9PEZI|nr:hypothetical protein L873DRAFT_1329523 [Choiromyces venosus 120613-1]